MNEKRYIAIEGPIGVGKTSLSNRLAEIFNAKLILEDLQTNPFLDDFYQDKKRYAFQTQIFFLLSRFKQHAGLGQRDLFSQCLMSDYLFARDRIFACLNLSDDELQLYDEIYSALKVKLIKPDLVIYLQASTEVLKQRIRKRAREFEKNISDQYLESLNAAFNNFFFHYCESPILIVDTTKIDYVSREKDFVDLVKKIFSTRRGKEYYMPISIE